MRRDAASRTVNRGPGAGAVRTLSQNCRAALPGHHDGGKRNWRCLSWPAAPSRDRSQVAVLCSACCPQVEFPGFARKILPEAVMRFFAHYLEPCLAVDMSRRTKNALGP